MLIEHANNRTGAPAERNAVRGYSAPPERILSSISDFHKRFVPKGRKHSHFLTRSGANRLGQVILILLCAAGLKYFYSTTSVNQLRWILAPTTGLVELISGQSFQFESHAGYINSDHSFLIAASCAGVNFLITAFLMLSLGHLWRNRTQSLSWTFLPCAALIAYLATLVANTVRITTALELRAMRIESSLLSPAQLHRFEGIFIYFGFLLLLYVLSERLSRAPEKAAADGFARPISGNITGLVFPLIIYYGTTLGIPFLNGAFRQGDFWEHSAFVLLIPLVFVIPFAGLLFLRRTGRAIKHS